MLNSESGAVLKRGQLGRTASPLSGHIYSQRASSNAAADGVKSLTTHAYISPIKLRRNMRNAPDLQSRLQLRRLESKQTVRTQRYKTRNARQNCGESTTQRDQAENKEKGLDTDRGGSILPCKLNHD